MDGSTKMTKVTTTAVSKDPSANRKKRPSRSSGPVSYRKQRPIHRYDWDDESTDPIEGVLRKGRYVTMKLLPTMVSVKATSCAEVQFQDGKTEFHVDPTKRSLIAYPISERNLSLDERSGKLTLKIPHLVKIQWKLPTKFVSDDDDSAGLGTHSASALYRKLSLGDFEKTCHWDPRSKHLLKTWGEKHETIAGYHLKKLLAQDPDSQGSAVTQSTISANLTKDMSGDQGEAAVSDTTHEKAKFDKIVTGLNIARFFVENGEMKAPKGPYKVEDLTGLATEVSKRWEQVKSQTDYDDQGVMVHSLAHQENQLAKIFVDMTRANKSKRDPQVDDSTRLPRYRSLVHKGDVFGRHGRAEYGELRSNWAQRLQGTASSTKEEPSSRGTSTEDQRSVLTSEVPANHR